MAKISQNKKIIFGLKIKDLRKEKGLSFAELSKLSGLSISYLNEIEKGKKFPKVDKIEALARVFETTIESLTNSTLENNLSPVSDLLQSNFLNELPLDLFGIEASKIVELIATAPTRVGAFISAILDVARKYELQEENFYFAALRSYQELRMNYFEEIEESVVKFSREFEIDTFFKIKKEDLSRILKQKYQYKITEGLDDDEDLKEMRFAFIPKKKTLYINKALTESQKIFILGREIAYNYLGLKERFNTTSIFKVKSFEQVLNNFKASYFAVALMINEKRFVKDVEQFFSRNKWDDQNLLNIVDKYGATSEMILYRFSMVLPKYFGIDHIFFLKFQNQGGKDRFDLTKELHLSKKHQPHANAVDEHYCRRWVSLWMLHGLHAEQQHKTITKPKIGVQKSHYIGTGEKYLCITLAYPEQPYAKKNISITLGLQVNENMYERVKFIRDEEIVTKKVHQTCERCAIEDCQERAAEPSIIVRKQNMVRLKKALLRLEKK